MFWDPAWGKQLGLAQGTGASSVSFLDTFSNLCLTAVVNEPSVFQPTKFYCIRLNA